MGIVIARSSFDMRTFAPVNKKVIFSEDFQVFIKPVGARCNLRCSYCYYLEKSDIYGSDVKTVMNDETLENCIKQHFAVSTADTVLFTWHGGEPLLAGIDFYKKVLSLQKKYLPKKPLPPS